MNLLKLLQKISTRLGYDEATDTINIEADNLALKDPILSINSQEIGAGITSGEAGILVNRGTELDAKLCFNEVEQSWQVGVEGSMQNFPQGTALEFANHVQTNDTLYWMGI